MVSSLQGALLRTSQTLTWKSSAVGSIRGSASRDGKRLCGVRTVCNNVSTAKTLKNHAVKLIGLSTSGFGYIQRPSSAVAAGNGDLEFPEILDSYPGQDKSDPPPPEEPSPEPAAAVEIPTAVAPEPEADAVPEPAAPEPDAVVESVVFEPEAVVESSAPEPEAVIESVADIVAPEPETVIESVAEIVAPEPEAVIESVAESSAPEPEAVVEYAAPEPEAVVESAAPEPEAVVVSVAPEPEPEAVVDSVVTETPEEVGTPVESETEAVLVTAASEAPPVEEESSAEALVTTVEVSSPNSTAPLLDADVDAIDGTLVWLAAGVTVILGALALLLVAVILSTRSLLFGTPDASQEAGEEEPVEGNPQELARGFKGKKVNLRNGQWR